MKRWLIGLQVCCVSMLAWSAALNTVAHAAPAHSSHKKKAKVSDKVPNSAEISKSMGDLHWGMSKDELEKKLIDKVKEKYRPLVAKTHDAMEEDRLRTQATNEMKRIHDSYVDFGSASTGWDVSFLRGEFTHGNGESMIVTRDQNSQNFYFFIDGKLWKWYKAFDAEVFRAGDFKNFADAVQRRFGPAKEAEGELIPGSGKRHWLEWQDDKTRLRAVDQTDFYGFYCLVFEEKATVANLAKLRRNTRDTGEKQNTLVDAITSSNSRDADTSADVVDRITGKSHGHDNPAPAAKGKGGKSKAAAADAESSAPAPSGVKNEDDPLRGLGL